MNCCVLVTYQIEASVVPALQAIGFSGSSTVILQMPLCTRGRKEVSYSRDSSSPFLLLQRGWC